MFHMMYIWMWILVCVLIKSQKVPPILRLLLGTVPGVMGAPAALYRYTSLCLHSQTHQK